MTEDMSQGESPLEFGVFKSPERGLTAADVIALALSAIWLIGIGAFAVFVPGASGGWVMTALAVVLPVALILMATMTAKSVRGLRDETARLQWSVDALRQAYVSQSQAGGMGVRPDVERKLDEIAAVQKETHNAIATFATTREMTIPVASTEPEMIKPGVPAGESQPTLALGAPPEDMALPLSVDDFIGALNFPEDEGDQRGFGQLRRALADRESGKLVRSSQDVLTLLSQDGIYMDDLHPDLARPEVWRSFASGARGRGIATLGGIHDRAALAVTAGRMRSDPVFRDTVHHFLRQFDRTFVDVAEVASDEDITRLSDTRTCRAFMLLGRVTGTFD